MTSIVFDPQGEHGLCIWAGDRRAWAFADFDDNVAMVPVTGGIERHVLKRALSMWWPTLTDTLWPDDLGVKTVEM